MQKLRWTILGAQHNGVVNGQTVWAVKLHGNVEPVEGAVLERADVGGGGFNASRTTRGSGNQPLATADVSAEGCDCPVCGEGYPAGRPECEDIEAHAVMVERLLEALEMMRFCYAQGVAPGSDWSVIAGFMDQLARTALLPHEKEGG